MKIMSHEFQIQSRLSPLAYHIMGIDDMEVDAKQMINQVSFV